MANSDVKLTGFERKVIKALKKIPAGRVSTYREIACFLGMPKAARAVGNALHKNPWAPRFPCHRVVKADGTIGGYAKGKNMKKSMLVKEGINFKNGKIIDFNIKFTPLN